MKIVVWSYGSFDNNFGIRKISQNILKESWCGNVLVNISPSNISLTMLLFARFNQNRQAAFGRCEH